MTQRTRRLWLLGLGVWTVLGLMSAAQNATWRAFIGRPIDWGSILPNSLGDWLTCGMFTFTGQRVYVPRYLLPAVK